MKKFTIKKGEHYSSPKKVKLLTSPMKKGFQWLIYFDDTCKYNLNSVDQLDWNKACGISLFDFIPNDNNSIRLGWRYNPESDKIELTAYVHDQGPTVFLPDEPFEVDPHKGIRVTIRTYVDKWVLEVTEIEAKKTKTFSYTPKEVNTYMFAYENGFYFGGNKTAPHDMALAKELTRC